MNTIFKKNNEELINELLIENYDKFYRMAYTYVLNEQDAMDIIQEAAYKAIKNSSKLKKSEYAKTWVYRIVINTALDFVRNRKYHLDIEDVNVPKEQKFEDMDLQQVLKSLPYKERTIITLRFYEEMKICQIAEIMDEKENTVKTILYRTLKKLRIELEGEENDYKK